MVLYSPGPLVLAVPAILNDTSMKVVTCPRMKDKMFATNDVICDFGSKQSSATHDTREPPKVVPM